VDHQEQQPLSNLQPLFLQQPHLNTVIPNLITYANQIHAALTSNHVAYQMFTNVKTLPNIVALALAQVHQLPLHQINVVVKL
jgi:hypothetical protein